MTLTGLKPLNETSHNLRSKRYVSVLIPAISWGDFPPESQIPPEKHPKHKKNVKKCIKFTPQICDPPSPELGV